MHQSAILARQFRMPAPLAAWRTVSIVLATKAIQKWHEEEDESYDGRIPPLAAIDAVIACLLPAHTDRSR